MSTQNILVFGLGGVGTVYAYVLNRVPNVQVTVVARSTYQRVKNEGLDFQSDKYGHHPNLKFHDAVSSLSDPSLATTDFDYIVCTHKAVFSNPSIPEQLKTVIKKNTVIVLIQNGVGIEEPYQELYPHNTVLSGVVRVLYSLNNVSLNLRPDLGLTAHWADLEGFQHKMNETMQFGAHFSSKIDRKTQEDHLNHFVKLLREGGTDVDLVPSIDLWRWKKTIWNACWNTLTALTQCRTDQFLGSSDSAYTVAKTLINEMNSIAAALGHEVEQEYLTSLIERDAIKQGIYSSMYADAKASRPMEVEAIVALPLRKAKQLGLKTPTLECIVALISAMDWRFRNGV